jgi:hypothetical protein
MKPLRDLGPRAVFAFRNNDGETRIGPRREVRFRETEQN